MASANGPARAVTPERRPVAASSASLARAAFAVTVTSAPRWAENACVKGPLVAASSASPRVAEAVATNSTTAMTIVWTL